MRKIFIWLFFLLLLFCGVFVLTLSKKTSKISVTKSSQKIHLSSPTPQNVQTSASLFVPYWTLTEPISSMYDRYIYFGITPDTEGINKHEQGFADIPTYSKEVPSGISLLTIAMTDKTINDIVLSSPALQKKIISDAIQIAKQYHFAGIVLDFEASGIGFNSVTQQVTNFILTSASIVHTQQLLFAVTLYGDTFYRARPYDVKKIAFVSDTVFVMAYDFHKAGGDPGPNFPFQESASDSYTFPTMINDFLTAVPKEKLSIIFGMFGYDWKVTDRGDAITTAQSLSDGDINKMFIAPCIFSVCSLSRNSALEPSITYRGSDNQKHIIWFEDSKSVDKKTNFLKTKGIGAIVFWAHSYF